MDQFRNEIANADIYNKLDPSTNGNPNVNYKILAEQLQYAESKHMPKRLEGLINLSIKKNG